MGDFDAALILLGFTGVILSWGLFLLIGRLLDPIYRVRQMRRFLRRNWLVMYFVSKDAKNIQPHVINADDDVFTFRDKLYVVENGKIYRKIQKNVGGKPVLDEKGQPVYEMEGGFSFNPKEGAKPVRYEEGTPVIFTDNEHIKPVDFFAEEHKEVAPAGAGSAINAWITNQIAKGLVGENKQAKYLLWGVIIIGLLLLANLAISYKNMEATNEIKAKCIAPESTGQTVQNNTLIISQPKAKTEGVTYVSGVPGL